MAGGALISRLLDRGSVLTFRPAMPRKDSVARIFSVGVPSAIATFLFDLDYVIVDRLMVACNDFALAAVGIVLKVERLPLNVGIGICQGMLPLVAYSCAAQNHRRMETTIRRALFLGLGVAADSLTVILSFFVYRRFRPREPALT